MDMMLANHVILNAKDAWFAIIIVLNVFKQPNINIGLMGIVIMCAIKV